MPSGHFPPTGPSSNRPQKSETSGLSHKPIIIDGLQTYEEFEKFVMLLGPLFNECNTDEEYVERASLIESKLLQLMGTEVNEETMAALTEINRDMLHISSLHNNQEARLEDIYGRIHSVVVNAEKGSTHK